tara:strand:- start:2496 stop:2714 length:219 start_codon:yes stop_codon:yes gene_type:complete
MSVNRRLFLAAIAGLPAMAAIKSVPAGAWIIPSEPGVGEVWGLRFLARGAVSAAAPGRRVRSAVPGWHPEFS